MIAFSVSHGIVGGMLEWLTTHWPTAAAWSAIAAFCAAGSSFLTFLVHRRNSHESVRPELTLDGWSRDTVSDDGDVESLTCSDIWNVGQGQALRIKVDCYPTYSQAPANMLLVAASTSMLGIVAAGDSESLDYQIRIFWKSLPGEENRRRLALSYFILYFDVHGNRYVTRYDLFLIQPRDDFAMYARLDNADSVMMVSRGTTMESAWRVKWFARSQRLSRSVNQQFTDLWKVARTPPREIERPTQPKPPADT